MERDPFLSAPWVIGLVVVLAGGAAVFTTWVAKRHQAAQSPVTTTQGVGPGDRSVDGTSRRNRSRSDAGAESSNALTRDGARAADSSGASKRADRRTGDAAASGHAADDASTGDEPEGFTEKVVGDWRVESLHVSSRVFLREWVDEDARRRRQQAAPPGERYAEVNVGLALRGRDPRMLVIERTSSRAPSMLLRVDGVNHDPVGRLLENRDPLSPLSLRSMSISTGERVNVRLAFLLPASASSASMYLDGNLVDTLTLPVEAPWEPSFLIGFWDKAAGDLGPLRYGDPLRDALGDERCTRMRVERNNAGLVQITIPCASMSSSGIAPSAVTGTAKVSLIRSGQTEPGAVRVIEGGGTLLLYVGSEGEAVFTFERDMGPAPG